ncbi:unnamed protein product [Caenorhabditis auriculariae]|uniref:EF-hand domain-containing protein n=1 Tax=Caenorhabditis auriculariae TaxID=2777116 RepID=A0A8S1HUS3_9PELO|nr:unnamed protein product [Caenorhabditis auriculariae]
MSSVQEDIQETFNFYDNKGDGKIAASQVGSALRSMMLNPTEEIVNTMTKQWHGNMEARVSQQEFTPIYHTVAKQVGKQPSALEFNALLSHFDRDGNGFIPVAQLRHMLQNTGEKMSVNDVNSLLFLVDAEEGKIKIDHFLKNHVLHDMM